MPDRDNQLYDLLKEREPQLDSLIKEREGPMPTLITRLDSYHQPNTPRTHDGQGHKLDEPVQCQGCLRSWPCDAHQLLSIIRQQGEEIQRLSDELREERLGL